MRNGPYELVKAPEAYPGKKYRGRYCYEHHLIYWQNSGLVPGEGGVIHHVNGDKRDNRIANLELLSVASHAKEHAKHRRVWCLCGFCNKEFLIKARHYRTRMKQNKFGKVFCSLSCGSKHYFSRVV